MSVSSLGRRPGAKALLVAAILLVCGASASAQALADRDAPLSFDAGQMKIDTKRKLRLLSGGVEITRGSFSMKAAEVELRETPQGDMAVAVGSAGQLASFKQRRDALDETIDGQAERIEYEQRTEVVRLIGKAVLKRWRGGVLAEEVAGQTVVYDHLRETFEVLGAGGSGGRVRGVVAPSNSRPDATPPAARPATGGAR